MLIFARKTGLVLAQHIDITVRESSEFSSKRSNTHVCLSTGPNIVPHKPSGHHDSMFPEAQMLFPSSMSGPFDFSLQEVSTTSNDKHVLLDKRKDELFMNLSGKRNNCRACRSSLFDIESTYCCNSKLNAANFAATFCFPSHMWERLHWRKRHGAQFSHCLCVIQIGWMQRCFGFHI